MVAPFTCREGVSSRAGDGVELFVESGDGVGGWLGVQGFGVRLKALAKGEVVVVLDAASGDSVVACGGWVGAADVCAIGVVSCVVVFLG